MGNAHEQQQSSLLSFSRTLCWRIGGGQRKNQGSAGIVPRQCNLVEWVCQASSNFIFILDSIAFI
jgi:hypothetical protein